MLASILIIVVSGALFGHWLRSVILVVANARSVERYAGQVAAMVRLNYPSVQAGLTQSQAAQLDRLYGDLGADFDMLTNLLRTSGVFQKFSHRFAMLGFRLAGLHYRLCVALPGGRRTRWPRRALGDMSNMVQFLAGSVGAHYAEGAPGSGR